MAVAESYSHRESHPEPPRRSEPRWSLEIGCQFRIWDSSLRPETLGPSCWGHASNMYSACRHSVLVRIFLCECCRHLHGRSRGGDSRQHWWLLCGTSTAFHVCMPENLSCILHTWRSRKCFTKAAFAEVCQWTMRVAEALPLPRLLLQNSHSC